MMNQLLENDLLELTRKQEVHEDRLLDIQNVVGVGVGSKFVQGKKTNQRAIQVLVNQKLPSDLLPTRDQIPSELDGVKTDVIDVGSLFAQNLDYGELAAGFEIGRSSRTNGHSGVVEIAARPAPALPSPVTIPSVSYSVGPQVLTQRVRPAMGGFSVGHPSITAGTIGTACYDALPFPGIPQRYYILSNNHVLAASNAASINDPIIQPGKADGGTVPADVIGRLAAFIPIQFHTPTTKPLNFVDAAIAEVPFHVASREIYWIGYLSRRLPQPVPPLKIGDILQKTGRTTNFTTGAITSLNATVDVNYGSGRVARFARQIVTTAMSAGGDSGSLVMDLEERAVGLLFAGSAVATIINPIDLVQSLLKIRLTEL